MKIVFIHYHLKTGGVTTVLRQQVETIQSDAEVMVLTGESAASPFPAKTITIPGLGYDRPDDVSIPPQAVAQSVMSAIQTQWHDSRPVIHVHNPTIAKNKRFLSILKILQEKKFNLFLQIHDFAEDGRPYSYFYEEYIPNVHYGVINSRDYRILLDAGLKKEGLHKIPNMIDLPEFKKETDDRQTHVLYPIRAIRRKNIGEAILLTLFFNPPTPLLITLPPNSPADFASYSGWKDFVTRHDLDVRFEAGLHHDFAALVCASRYLITTSITEGFGFSFLEPWLFGKILWGRMLPHICDDFVQNGIDLRHLYTHLMVPVEWCGRENLIQKLKTGFIQNRERFNYSLRDGDIESALETVAQKNCIDFGMLDEAFQKRVIVQLLAGTGNRMRMMKLNPFLAHPAFVKNKAVLIERNRAAVLNSYNRAKYRDRLLKIYRQISQTPVEHRINKQTLLSSFFKPDLFSLLKWSPYAG